MDRKLKGKGEVDYDYPHDTLFFKIKDRDYDRSLELDNIVLDIDAEKFITGIQIFEASKFLRTPKLALKNIPHWKFDAHVENNRIEVRLAFQILFRNKIIEKNPIIVEPITESLPESSMECVIA